MAGHSTPHFEPQPLPASPVEHLQHLIPDAAIGRRVLALDFEPIKVTVNDRNTGHSTVVQTEKPRPHLGRWAENSRRGKRTNNKEDLVDPFHMGNHYNVPPLRDSKKWRDFVRDPRVQMSAESEWLLLRTVGDKSAGEQAQIERAKDIPKIPAHLRAPNNPEDALSRDQILELTPIAQQKTGDLTPSIRDYQIDIDRLSHDRRVMHLVPDAQGRTPEDPEYVETVIPTTYVTIEDIRRYLSENPMEHRTDRRFFEPYLKHPEAKAHEPSSKIQRAMMWLAVKAGMSIDEGYPWTIEKMEAMDNEAMTKEIMETTGTGPDEIVRLIEKYHKNSNDIYVDDDGNELSEKLLLARNNVIELIRRKPPVLAALLRYGSKKRSPEEYYQLLQHMMNVGTLEAELPPKTVAGHIIGEVYYAASHGNIGKQSYITHPVRRYESGPKKGMEMWKTVPDEIGKNLWKDATKEGNAIRQASVLYDSNNNPYYLTDPKNPSSRRVAILQSAPEIEYTEDGRPYYVYDGETRFVNPNHLRNGRLMSYEADGITETMVAVKDEHGIERQVHKALLLPTEYKIPDIDESRLEIGKLKVREFSVEIGIRWASNQFAIEPSQLSATKDVILELGRRLDRSFYEPGFVEPGGKTRKHRLGGRLDKRKPFGRESQEYREALFAMSMLWSGLSLGLKNGPESGDKEAEIPPELRDRMQVWAPRMYGAGSTSNRMLVEIASLLDAFANKHPAAKELPWGDFLEVQREFKS